MRHDLTSPLSTPPLQVHSLEGQMEITQDELAQKDAQLEALRCVAGGGRQPGVRRRCSAEPS